MLVMVSNDSLLFLLGRVDIVSLSVIAATNVSAQTRTAMQPVSDRNYG